MPCRVTALKTMKGANVEIESDAMMTGTIFFRGACEGEVARLVRRQSQRFLAIAQYIDIRGNTGGSTSLRIRSRHQPVDPGTLARRLAVEGSFIGLIERACRNGIQACAIALLAIARVMALSHEAVQRPCEFAFDR